MAYGLLLQRLAAAFGDASLIDIAGVFTFVSIDAPEAVANAIVVSVTADHST